MATLLACVSLRLFVSLLDGAVEENRGVAVFLYTFWAKTSECVEENEGVAIFLYTFREKAVFGVEENRGVTIFLPFFDKNVIFTVEENRGVPVFLYTFAQNLQRTAKKRRWPAASDRIRCGVGLRPTDWNQAEAPPPGALPYGKISGRKSGWARLPLFSYFIWRGSRRLPYIYRMR